MQGSGYGGIGVPDSTLACASAHDNEWAGWRVCALRDLATEGNVGRSPGWLEIGQGCQDL